MLAVASALLLAGAPAPDAGALRAADVAFSRALAARDRAAFEALVDEEAIFGVRLLEGRRAIGEAWSVFLAEGGPRLTWAPDEAILAASGDLGYTVGHARLEQRGTDGAPVVRDARYVTVWRRGPDGRFRALLDLALAPEAAGTPGLVRTARRTATSAAGDLEATLGSWTRDSGDGPRTGVYLVVRRREPGGALADVVTTAVPAREPPRPSAATTGTAKP